MVSQGVVALALLVSQAALSLGLAALDAEDVECPSLADDDADADVGETDVLLLQVGQKLVASGPVPVGLAPLGGELDLWASAPDEAGPSNLALEARLLDGQLERAKAKVHAASTFQDVPTELLERSKPLSCIHVPMSGSPFVNLMVDLPGVCSKLPREVTQHPDGGLAGVQQGQAPHSLTRNALEQCNPMSLYRSGGHRGIGDDIEFGAHYSGHSVTMLRQPEQRVISAYLAGQNSWPLERPAQTLMEFAQVVQGCAVRMLGRAKFSGDGARDTCGGGNKGPPTEEELHTAIERFNRGFVFVGITEEWPLSVCLSHRMLGGACRNTDFSDTPITTYTRPQPHDTTNLHGFTDRYDGQLYHAARRVFNRNLQHYNVSMSSCQPCFAQAGITVQ